jgi:hypothetical protein
MFRRCRRVLPFGNDADYKPLAEVSVPQPRLDVHWIHDVHAKVMAGILTDTVKLQENIALTREQYAYYVSILYSQKRFPDFEATIDSMTSTLWQFPQDVIKTMCMDTIALIDNGDLGALKILRSTDTRGIRECVTNRYMRKWKVDLYRRAVWEYLVTQNEERRWPSLELGNTTTKDWLSDRFSDLVHESPIDPETTDFIVDILFPKKGRKGECAPEFSNHGTPESAEERGLESD